MTARKKPAVRRAPAGRVKQLETVRAAVAVPPSKVSLASVVPVFVPDSLATPKWMGPILPMEVKGLAVTWAALMRGPSMLYVTHEMDERWTKRHGDWRMKSMENLAKMTPELSSHSMLRPDGEPYGLVMMQEDGVGPSRLLFFEALEEVFPKGYSCAIPERSVGIVLSKTATAAERAKVKDVVDQCYRHGTAPLVKGLFKPEALRPR